MTATRRRFLRMAGCSVVASAATGALACSSAASGRRRWAMVIDPRKCLEHDGCTDCITACHRAHNVPAIPDRAHEVKWVWKEQFPRVFASEDADVLPADLRGRDMLVFCNHCDNPPCVRVCPTQATWKRDDGIVTIDEHRCIGCRYCMAACPYGSRSFNWVDPRPHLVSQTPGYPTRTRGVVEKCNLCEERIARGEAPHCVAACGARALVFGDLRDPTSDVRRLIDRHYTIRRKPELGTRPQVYYIVGQG